MSRHNLRDSLTDFYAERSLPSSTTHRLKVLAKVDLEAASRTFAPRFPARWAYVLVGFTSSVALIVSAVSLYLVASGLGRIPGPESGELMPVSHPRNLAVLEEGTVPRFVTVKFQFRGCPLSDAVEPLFNELIEKYEDMPVIFARFDFTDEASLRQSHSLTLGLGIDWIYEGPYQSGMIKLIDRYRNVVLVTVTDREQLPQMENALALAEP